MSVDASAWLVVIDPQHVFADPASPWGSPFFDDAMERIQRLAATHRDRVLVTRWVPTADRATSWGAYFQAWPFADKPETDPLFALVPAAGGLTSRPTIDRPSFGKFSPELLAVTGHAPRLVLCGVSTDCCVISTALAAADAGAYVTVVTDACAGSTQANHDAAVQVMSLYEPQITLTDTAALVG
ncbi:cysteine hydrolase family protein [Microbacterium luticocti]|uniref:cysteine hydrolase family protein n=1 Tax=Microbacterium luticocti TaxID=451764 RepID=UPI0003F9A4B7|nr:isochorismatase family protein [Microbacterium luticocti]